jgi:hypothetical protein
VLTPQIKWSVSFGGDQNEEGWYVLSTDDGGCLVLGYTESYGAGEQDIYLVKVDQEGNVEWSKTYGGAGHDYAKAVFKTDDSYVITGFTSSYGSSEYDYDAIVIKTDINGIEQWNYTYGGFAPDEAYSIIQTVEGDFVITGYTISFSADYSEDLWLIKINENGQEIWNKTFGGNGIDYGKSIIETNDGYVIAGKTKAYSSNIGYSDAWLLKVNKTGQHVWNHTYGFEYDDLFNQIIELDDGFAMVGNTQNMLENQLEELEYSNGYIVITDENGELLFERVIEEEKETGISSIVQTDDGYVAVGYMGEYGTGEGDILVEKIDSSVNRVWMKSYGGDYGDAGIWIDRGSDNNYFVVGYSDEEGLGLNDIRIMKLQID